MEALMRHNNMNDAEILVKLFRDTSIRPQFIDEAYSSGLSRYLTETQLDLIWEIIDASHIIYAEDSDE